MRTIRVKVKPNARAAAFGEQADGTWVAAVKAAPADGKANDELIALIARHFGTRKAQVTIRHGASARMKLVDIAE